MKLTCRLLAAVLLLASFSLADAHLPPPEKFCRFDPDGFPLAGGKLYTYSAGTTDDKVTYTDNTAGAENENPVILDSSGCANVWLGSGSYKFVLTDANGVQLWEVDYVTAAAPTWGAIGGTLSDQTDLQAALDAKLDDSQLDTDITLAANSNTKIASQKAVKSYAVPQSRTISTTAPLTGGGALSSNLTLTISAFTGDSGSGGAKGAVPAPAAGDAAANKFLSAGGGFSTVGPGGANFQKVRTTSVCTTGSSSYATCTTTLNWPVTFAASTYTVVCSGVTPGGGVAPAATLNVYAKSTTQVTVQVQTQRSQTATFASVECIGVN